MALSIYTWIDDVRFVFGFDRMVIKKEQIVELGTSKEYTTNARLHHVMVM